MKKQIRFLLTLSIAYLLLSSCETQTKEQVDSQIQTESSEEIAANIPEWELEERRIVLEGAQNFRDLGGYTTASRERISWNKLYRSDKLSELSDMDVERLAHLGIKTVIDLRSDPEVEREPSRLPEGVKIQRLPMWREAWNAYLTMNKEQRDSLQKAMKEAGSQPSIEESYVAFPDEFESEVAYFFSVLADEENYPILFHCTAGTDRTGFLSALTLAHLGVPDSVIVEDYALSQRFRLNREEKDVRIKKTFERIEERGGMEAYLKGIENLDEETLMAVRANLVN